MLLACVCVVLNVGLDRSLTLKCVLTPTQPWWTSTSRRVVQWKGNLMPGRLHFHLCRFLIPLILCFVYLFYPPPLLTFFSLYLLFPSSSRYLFYLPSFSSHRFFLVPHVCFVLSSASMLKCVQPTKGGGWKEN